MVDEKKKPAGVLVYTISVGSHDVLISGIGYEGDHHAKRPHLDIPESALEQLGWDSNTYLIATIYDGKMVIEKDIGKYKAEAVAMRERIEAEIAEKARTIAGLEQHLALLKEQDEKLNRMLAELKKEE